MRHATHDTPTPIRNFFTDRKVHPAIGVETPHLRIVASVLFRLAGLRPASLLIGQCLDPFLRTRGSTQFPWPAWCLGLDSWTLTVFCAFFSRRASWPSSSPKTCMSGRMDDHHHHQAPGSPSRLGRGQGREPQESGKCPNINSPWGNGAFTAHPQVLPQLMNIPLNVMQSPRPHH